MRANGLVARFASPVCHPCLSCIHHRLACLPMGGGSLQHSSMGRGARQAPPCPTKWCAAPTPRRPIDRCVFAAVCAGWLGCALTGWPHFPPWTLGCCLCALYSSTVQYSTVRLYCSLPVEFTPPHANGLHPTRCLHRAGWVWGVPTARARGEEVWEKESLTLE